MIGMNRNVEYWKKEIATQIVYTDLEGFIEAETDTGDFTKKEVEALEKAAYYVGRLLERTYLE